MAAGGRPQYVAIDGEGVGRKPHRYVYLAAVDESGRLWGSIADERGLSTERVLDFLTSLSPPKRRLFGYSLGYDVAKWLADVPNEMLYLLLRPELRTRVRKSRRQLRDVYWRSYRLSYLRGKFVVAKTRWDPETRRSVPIRGRTVTVWDVWRFYQGAFVRALKEWRVGSQPEVAFVESTKARRSDLINLARQETEKYCRLECRLLAQLVRLLDEAAESVDLVLRDYFGAGSFASAFLRKVDPRKSAVAPPEEMWSAIMTAFVGGRFEGRFGGPLRRPCSGRDIYSAYPYVLSGMPCLLHGRWEHVTDAYRVQSRVERSRLACVHASVDALSGGWGALAHRARDGTITWPARCRTWVWRDEYLAASRGWDATATDAWVYDSDCDCRPFAQLAELYVERVRVGKDTGAGIALKLLLNSCFGKLVQAVGSAPFRNMVWGGCITSGCRAMVLDALSRSGESAVMVATDAVYLTRDVELAAPRETGTSQLDKPLGAWGLERYPEGLFIARPGVYFPLGAKLDPDKLRARGLSRKTLAEHADAMVGHWESWARDPDPWDECPPPYQVTGIERFVGAVTGVQLRGTRVLRSKDYGDWVDWPVDVTFHPRPKRRRLLPSGALDPWLEKDGDSEPYRRGVVSAEADLLKRLEAVLAEQPHGEV